MNKTDRQYVWEKSNGLCWYCGIELPEKGWHIDHVKPVYRVPVKKHKDDGEFGPVPTHIKKLLNQDSMEKPKNDNIDNMVPACAPCNLFKGVFDVEEFRREIELQKVRCRKYSSGFRIAERMGIIDVLEDMPVIFWFEENKKALETKEE